MRGINTIDFRDKSRDLIPVPSPVILSPSPAVILSRAKDLGFRLRVNSAKDLATY